MNELKQNIIEHPPHHLIFEGAELVGKSHYITKVYNQLEKKYNTGSGLLDGCHWFNCDIGAFGGSLGSELVEGYVDIAKRLKSRNIIFEKLHLSDQVNSQLLNNTSHNYAEVEEKLNDLGFKIILFTIEEDLKIWEQRIKDRLEIYPHYERILHEPGWYLEQQQRLRQAVEQSQLDHFIVDSTKIPDGDAHLKILKWLGED